MASPKSRPHAKIVREYHAELQAAMRDPKHDLAVEAREFRGMSPEQVERGLVHAMGPNKGYAKMYGSMGTLHMGTNKPKAGRYLRKAIELDPKNANIRLNYGAHLIKEGDLEGAIKHLEASAELSPNAVTFFNLSQAYEQLGNTKKADEWMGRVKSAPRGGEVHSGLGYIFAENGEYQKAAEHYRHALSVNPQDVTSRVNLGNVLSRMGKGGEALEHYKKAAKIEPDDVGLHENWGSTLGDLGRFKEAAEQFRRCTELAPSDPNMHEYLAMALRGSGDATGALKAYNTARRLRAERG